MSTLKTQQPSPKKVPEAPAPAALILSVLERKALKATAHHLSPVVAIGDAGLTPAVLKEIDVALRAHELIKIRVHGDDREARAAMLNEIVTQSCAGAVQHIGKLLVIYRPKTAAQLAKKPTNRRSKKPEADALAERRSKKAERAKRPLAGRSGKVHGRLGDRLSRSAMVGAPEPDPVTGRPIRKPSRGRR
jgi:RNA-binding protein